MKITDKKELVKIVSFLVMGSGNIHKSEGAKNYVFSFSQTKEHMDLVIYVKDVINSITSCKVKILPKNLCKVQSVAHPFFKPIHKRIYMGTYKSIDPHALRLMDWSSLAILYMCAGCLKSKNRGRLTATLNLHRLSYGDMFLLKKSLNEKFDLEWNIVRSTLQLRKKHFNKFMEGIKPFVFGSFKHKLYLRTTNPSTEGDDIV